MFSITLTTVSNKENGLLIARELTKARLCACVNILEGATSVYFWKGELCEESELLLFIKAPQENFEKIKEKILELHEYELPEIVELPIGQGYEKYLKWIEEETRLS